MTAADQVLGLKLTPSQRSEFARRGSGSAARSIFGGFAEMAAGERADGSDCIAHSLAEPEHWPLKVLVAVTSRSAKPVSSTDGMNQTMKTSPYYPAWVAGVAADLDEARDAIMGQDFERLAEVSEFSALKMHASALAARPGVIYWNARHHGLYPSRPSAEGGRPCGVLYRRRGAAAKGGLLAGGCRAWLRVSL